MGGSNSMLAKIGTSDSNFSIEIRCKVFFIVDDDTAASYAELLTEIKNFEHYTHIETESVTNQDGEMTKIITYEVRNKVRK